MKWKIPGPESSMFCPTIILPKKHAPSMPLHNDQIPCVHARLLLNQVTSMCSLQISYMCPMCPMCPTYSLHALLLLHLCATTCPKCFPLTTCTPYMPLCAPLHPPTSSYMPTYILVYPYLPHMCPLHAPFLSPSSLKLNLTCFICALYTPFYVNFTCSLNLIG